MENGISIYPGLDNTLEENLQLIETAARYGIHRLFTSLHIPETDTTALKREFGLLLQAAHRHDMEIISDVSPAMLPLLGLKEFNPTALRMLGITTLRLDDGFSWQEIAELTRRYPELRIQLNASTTTRSVLQHLREANADFSKHCTISTRAAAPASVKKRSSTPISGCTTSAYASVLSSPVRKDAVALRSVTDFPPLKTIAMSQWIFPPAISLPSAATPYSSLMLCLPNRKSQLSPHSGMMA